MSDELLLAGLAGLAGLGLAGGVAAMIRRRRRRPDAGDATITPVPDKPLTSAAPVASTASVVTRAPEREKAPAFTTAQAMKRSTTPLQKVDRIVSGSLIEQIDYTKPAGYYSANVDAVPTPINPFLTRTNRLRRAHFLDRQLEKRVTRKVYETPVSTPKTRERVLEPA